jgi:ABC-type uncharacterized transport system fused permease/ATPase subunit
MLAAMRRGSRCCSRAYVAAQMRRWSSRCRERARMVRSRRYTAPNGSTDAEGRTQLATLVAVSLLRTLLMNRMADLTRRFNAFAHATSAPSRNMKRVLPAMLSEAAFAIAAGAALTSVRSFATASLTIAFRKRLTDRVHALYFNRGAYYHIGNLPARRAIPDADQRISSEIGAVATRLTTLVTLLIKATPPLFWFTCVAPLISWNGCLLATCSCFFDLISMWALTVSHLISMWALTVSHF